MKKIWTKVGIVASFILIAIMAAYIVKLQWDAKSQRDALNKSMIEMKQLQDGIIRNQSKYVSRDDLEDFAEDLDLNLGAIQDDLDQYGRATIKGIAALQAQSVGYRGSNLGSSGTRPKDPNDPNNPEIPACPDGTECPDPYGYMTNEQLYSMNEPFSDGTQVPIGTVGFSAWKPKPWSVEIYPRKYQVATVLGQDEDGRHYVYNKMQVDVNGEKHTLPIKQAELKEVYPEADFRFDPHINLGVDVGASVATGSVNPDEPSVTADVVPNVSVTFFSYGQTKVRPDWTFLGLGIGYEAQRNSVGAYISPVNYNVGKHIPLMDNLYIGPTVGADIEGNVMIGGGIKVGL